MTLSEPTRLSGWDDLRAKGIVASKATFWRRIKAGSPLRRCIPGKSPAWPEHEIDLYILSLIAQRDASSVEVA